MEGIYYKLIEKIDTNRVLKNESMSKHTTLKIGGPADIFVRVENVDELKYVVEQCIYTTIPITVIGNGSNILVKDRRNQRSSCKTRFKRNWIFRK